MSSDQPYYSEKPVEGQAPTYQGQPMQPGMQPEMQPPMQPAMQPGMQPAMQPPMQPAMQPGMQPGMQPVYQNTQPGYNPPMTQPLIPGQQPVVINQVQPIVVGAMMPLRSHSVTVMCPFCKTTVNTNADPQCSCLNFCCCFFTSPILWIIFQAARGKDINCCDANHTCPKCGAQLGRYEAC